MKTITATLMEDRSVTEAALNEARRGQLRHKSGLQATAVSYINRCVVVGFLDGSGVLLPVQHYPEFDHNSQIKRQAGQFGSCPVY